MSQLGSDTLDLIETHLRGCVGELAESLHRCFDGPWELTPLERGSWESTANTPALAEAGVLVALTVGSQSLLLAVPASLPLPDWMHSPDMSQQSRMDTLGMEWSLIALPEAVPCDAYQTLIVPSLVEAILEAVPDSGAVCLPLETRRGETVSRLWCVWPVLNVPAGGQNDTGQRDAEENDRANGPAGIGGSAPSAAGVLDGDLSEGGLSDAEALADQARTRLARLVPLPVTVVVRLAEKRIPLGQILTLGPGAIITFEKSCEDLLDLHVNNSLYARGEAVKIGEKFGLKINEVGSIKQRASAILQPHR